MFVVLISLVVASGRKNADEAEEVPRGARRKKSSAVVAPFEKARNKTA
jgi:hypothetical protein